MHDMVLLAWAKLCASCLEHKEMRYLHALRDFKWHIERIELITIAILRLQPNVKKVLLFLIILVPQFPDPHFKHRHKKRRIVQPSFIAHLASLMPTGGIVVYKPPLIAVHC